LGQQQNVADLALQDWLCRKMSDRDGEGHGLAGQPEPSDSELDTVLRSWGYNRREREDLRRALRAPKSKRDYKPVILKQFRFYIDERLGDRTPTPDTSRLAAVWASLTEYKIQLAQWLWSIGFDPADPAQVDAFLEGGYCLQDLETEVNGKTIAEHLRDGEPLQWCLAALSWNQHHS
jgi:hypothetical protein